MTKQELTKMMGDEDKAEWVMQRVLECVKKDFVVMCLKAYADKCDAEITAKETNGYYTEFSTFPEGFNYWEAVATSDPLADQYDLDEERQTEKAGDLMQRTFARNMWVRAINH